MFPRWVAPTSKKEVVHGLFRLSTGTLVRLGRVDSKEVSIVKIAIVLVLYGLLVVLSNVSTNMPNRRGGRLPVRLTNWPDLEFPTSVNLSTYTGCDRY